MQGGYQNISMYSIEVVCESVKYIRQTCAGTRRRNSVSTSFTRIYIYVMY
jgi:hypothetical protein